MTTHRITARIFGLLLVAASAPAIHAAGMFKCQVNGVTTFTDSPRGCPEATESVAVPEATSRSDGLPSRKRPSINATPSMPDRRLPARLEPSRARNPSQGVASPAAPASLPAAVAATGALNPNQAVAAPPSGRCVQQFPNDKARHAECLLEERRAEVRRVATARLAGISRAISDYAGMPARTDGVLAVGRDGKPARWCQDILGDVMAGRNITVLDDEVNTEGPKWITTGGAGGKAVKAGPLLDTTFTEWLIAGQPVVHGYVTVRWRNRDVVALRAVAACSAADPTAVACNAQRYTAIFVHDSAVPQACQLLFVGRPYWDQWKSSMTQIDLQSPGR